MLIGYARISTPDQSLDLQIDALKQLGCEQIFKDIASGSKTTRAGLDDALKFARSGDTLTVWRLDRLGRSLQHLIEVVAELQKRGVGFRSIMENMDTNTPGGMLIFHLFGSLAEFERNLIIERTMSGLAAARARGRVGGRPKVMDAKKVAMAQAMLADRSQSIRDTAKVLGVSRSTLYSYLQQSKT